MTDTPKEAPTPYRLIGPSDSGEVSDLLNAQNAKDAKHRLQALIAEWLRMENLVVLSGAGTSVTSGGKIMANLENAVLDTVKETTSVPDGVVKDHVLKIIEGRKAESRKSGFEDWLSFLVNASHLATAPASPFSGVQWKGSINPTQADLAWLVQRAGQSIFAECALSLPDAPASGSSQIAPHLSFLAKLVARDSNLGRAHLFTLNYDTLFEQALELLGIQYFDGFTGRADARFDPSVYGLDIYYPGEVAEGRVRRFDKFVHLYKLHGSIHWQVRGDELRARHPDLQPFTDYRSLDCVARAARLDALAKSLPSVGILPTANKFAQTLSMPFAHLFRSFQIRLGAPQTFLLVLGYGFGDDHVTRIIETALMNPSLVMLVVEPDPKSATIERVRRYKDLGKRAFVLTPTDAAFTAAKFTHATFDDFARSVMPDVQWLEDFLRLRRFEKQIAAGRTDANDDPGP
ncbi:MAG: SIR2 family protein [Alphaproteobacteria bacterium]|nr:SIR2 family protein [Alphaproteobacteria bacterium]QQS57266.1 MAG: SIR2 family protein [Alphaproteobacteria bacterium]